MNIGDISSPIMYGDGNTFHGTISAGNYRFNIWGYPQFYNPIGAEGKDEKVSYIDDNKVIMLPQMMYFDFAYGAVPHIAMGNEMLPRYIDYVAGDFSYHNYIDDDASAHIMGVKSAGIPIPTQIDAIYTLQVVS